MILCSLGFIALFLALTIENPSSIDPSQPLTPQSSILNPQSTHGEHGSVSLPHPLPLQENLFSWLRIPPQAPAPHMVAATGDLRDGFLCHSPDFPVLHPLPSGRLSSTPAIGCGATATASAVAGGRWDRFIGCTTGFIALIRWARGRDSCVSAARGMYNICNNCFLSSSITMNYINLKREGGLYFWVGR